MPLPKPRDDENRSDFVTRCMSDEQVLSDFSTINQRYAVCNNIYGEPPVKKQVKLNRNKFRRAYKKGYQKLYKTTARKNNKIAVQFYKKGFNNAIKDFVRNNEIIKENYTVFFQEKTTKDMYLQMYTQTSLAFYNWYLNSYKSFIKKQVSTEETMTDFITQYVLYSGRLNTKINSVQKTAIKSIVSEFTKAMKDEQFAKESRLGKSKILQKRLNGRALWEARRIVVTETTLASNLGAEKAAMTAFKKEELVKDWIIGSSINHREGHLALDGQDPIPMDKSFQNPVTGVYMRIPGEGPSSETINCSCSVAFIPNPELFNE